MYRTMISDGTHGRKWISRLENQGIHVSPIMCQVLESHNFEATKGVMYSLGIIDVSRWQECDRITRNIITKAELSFLEKPSLEATVLAIEMLARKGMDEKDVKFTVAFHPTTSCGYNIGSILTKDPQSSIRSLGKLEDIKDTNIWGPLATFIFSARA